MASDVSSGTVPRSPPISVRDVLAGSVRLILQRPWLLVGIEVAAALVIGALMVALAGLLPRSALPFAQALLPAVVTSFAITLVVRLLIQQEMEGWMLLGPAFDGLLRVAFAVLATFIVLGTGVLVGLVVLVVPGLIVLAAWSVAIPACVAEELGPISALKRSWRMTRGQRWPMLAIMVITTLPMILDVMSAALPVAVAILLFPVRIAASLFQTGAITLAYLRLRESEERGRPVPENELF